MNERDILAFTADDRWQVGIGDPTVIGWLTVVAYFAATFLCCNAAVASAKHGLKKEGWFWLLFTGFLLFLGINKQLDLQTWLTLFGRHLAEDEGWYAQRRAVQAAFVAFVAVVGASVLVFLWQWGKRDVRHYRLALFGGVFLGCFIVIRAASFHYVDNMLALQFSNVTVNCTLELGGIFCVAIAAAKNWRDVKNHEARIAQDSRH